MTIKEYMESLKRLDGQFKPSTAGRRLSEVMADTCQIWSNTACKGYLIRAAERAKIDSAKIRELLDNMECAFGDISVDDAEQIYNASSY